MDIETNFLARLFAQFKNSPNILALIEILSDPLQDTDNVLTYISENFSIDDAEGEQLDFIGELIGVIRPPLQETRIFTLCRKGEIQEPDKGFYDDENPGGYLVTMEGLKDQDDPTAEFSDADFRKLIRQKAATYRKKATIENLFNYLLDFGARCKLDDTTDDYQIWIDPVRYDDYNAWQRNYIENRGFKPAVVSINFKGTTRHKDSI